MKTGLPSNTSTTTGRHIEGRCDCPRPIPQQDCVNFISLIRVFSICCRRRTAHLRSSVSHKPRHTATDKRSIDSSLTRKNPAVDPTRETLNLYQCHPLPRGCQPITKLQPLFTSGSSTYAEISIITNASRVWQASAKNSAFTTGLLLVTHICKTLNLYPYSPTGPG